MIFFTPKIIEKVQSSINGEIKVVSDFGKLRLVVGGLTQSEGLTTEIWEKGIKKISIFNPPTGGQFSNCLILGLGGGTVVGVINKYLPETKITAIEIDPVMVDLGKKYFGLGKYKNLKIIFTDAFKIINHQPLTINHPDLIIVDLFIGENMPQKSTSLSFLRSLKKMLSKAGILLINRLFYKTANRTNTEKLIANLNTLFRHIELIRCKFNLLVLCQK